MRAIIGIETTTQFVSKWILQLYDIFIVRGLVCSRKTFFFHRKENWTSPRHCSPGFIVITSFLFLDNSCFLKFYALYATSSCGASKRYSWGNIGYTRRNIAVIYAMQSFHKVLAWLVWIASNVCVDLLESGCGKGWDSAMSPRQIVKRKVWPHLGMTSLPLHDIIRRDVTWPDVISDAVNMTTPANHVAITIREDILTSFFISIRRFMFLLGLGSIRVVVLDPTHECEKL